MPDNLYRRRKGGPWYGRTEVDGREFRKSLRTTHQATAKARLKKWLDGFDQTRFTGGERHTWQAAVGKYMTEVLPHAVKPNTAKRYRVSLGQLGDHLDGLYVDEITRKTFAGIISKRTAELPRPTNATIRRDLTAASRVLAACVAWGWRDDNPARELDRSAVPERRQPRVLPTDDQVSAVEGVLHGNLKRLWRTLDQTGMREDEAADLERPQVDQARGITLTRTKTNRPRIIPFTDPRVAPAAGTISGTPTSLMTPYVFWHSTTDADGKPSADRYRNVSSLFARAIKGLGYDFVTHDLRHKFAVDYLRRGGNIYALQKIMGHKSIKTTEIYLDYLTPAEAEIARGSAQESAQV